MLVIIDVKSCWPYNIFKYSNSNSVDKTCGKTFLLDDTGNNQY